MGGTFIFVPPGFHFYGSFIGYGNTFSSLFCSFFLTLNEGCLYLPRFPIPFLSINLCEIQSQPHLFFLNEGKMIKPRQLLLQQMPFTSLCSLHEMLGFGIPTHFTDILFEKSCAVITPPSLDHGTQHQRSSLVIGLSLRI